MWNLPWPGLKPVSLALAGRFLTTAPPGKPQSDFSLIPLGRRFLLGFCRKEWPLRGSCAWLGGFPRLSLPCRPLALPSLPGALSALYAPAFKSDHGLSVLWSLIMQGEELWKAISRVWRVHTCPFQMLALSHTPASLQPVLSSPQALGAAV